MSMLEVRGVTKKIGSGRGINDLSLQLEAGKISCVVGPNGAGKTTLFNLICGFIWPGKGQIFFRGREITQSTPRQIARLGVRRLFQDARVVKRLTALDNVTMAFAGQAGESALMSVVARWRVARQERELREKSLALLDSVGLSGAAHSPAEMLSYGQQRLLALAMLLPADAELFLLDEPTAGIFDPHLMADNHVEGRAPPEPRAGTDAVLKIIRKMAEDGKTVLIIEHNLDVVTEIADCVYYMDGGRIVFSGRPDEVLSRAGLRGAEAGI